MYDGVYSGLFIIRENNGNQVKERNYVRRKQVKKDFEELHIGQNTDALIKKYYSKKKKEMLLLLISGFLVLFLVVRNEYRESLLPEKNTIIRNENGEGKRELQLEVKAKDGEWQEVSFELQEREYEEEELEEMFQSAKKSVSQLILGENQALNYVFKDLNLIQEIEGFPFLLTWETSRPELIDSLGEISEQEIPSGGILIDLKVCFRYQEWEKEEIFSIRLYPDYENVFISELKRNLKELEKNSRKESEFYLPEIFQENTLQWRYAKDNASFLLGIIFLVLLPFIDYQKDRDIHKLVKERRNQLQREYPGFISKLILYMEAGMNVDGAVFRIAEDYQKKRKKGKEKSYLYEEIVYVCKQKKNGLSQKDSYELLGKRCNLPCYKKLTGLLTQHLQKGSYGILDTLRTEAVRANEERKKQIKKQGEEMGTKLLLPMIMMLAIVMVFIMVPACFSFRM